MNVFKVWLLRFLVSMDGDWLVNTLPGAGRIIGKTIQNLISSPLETTTEIPHARVVLYHGGTIERHGLTFDGHVSH